MVRHLVLAALGAMCANAQFDGVAVNFDGSEVLFESPYALKSGPDFSYLTRIYRHKPGQPEELQRAGMSFTSLQLTGAYLSDDGQTRGYFTYQPCVGSCMLFFPRGGITLERNGKTVQASGQDLRISRNGRWLFGSGFPLFSARRLDFDTGTATALPAIQQLHPAHAIADNGDIVSSAVGRTDAILLTPANGEAQVEVPLPGPVLSAAITPSGSRIIAMTARVLYAIDRTTMTAGELYRSEEDLSAIDISAAGDRILVLAGREVRLVAGSNARVLFNAEAPVRSITLTGDGMTGIVVTASNQMVRLTETGVEELYPRFSGRVSQSFGATSPGSLLRLSGGPFYDEQTITSQGQVFPFVANENGVLETQVPWEIDASRDRTFILSAPNSPFVVSAELGVSMDPLPGVYSNYNQETNRYEAKAAQADFGALISRENPAKAGSVVHFWLTGMGPLDRTLATGERGPSSPPARIATPFACYLYPGDNPRGVRGLEIPFAAYAPGLLGVYQVDAVIPADWPAGLSSFACATGSRGATGGGAFYVSR